MYGFRQEQIMLISWGLDARSLDWVSAIRANRTSPLLRTLSWNTSCQSGIEQQLLNPLLSSPGAVLVRANACQVRDYALEKRQFDLKRALFVKLLDNRCACVVSKLKCAKICMKFRTDCCRGSRPPRTQRPRADSRL